MGTKPSYALVYHQQAKGMVERQHKVLKCPATPTLGSRQRMAHRTSRGPDGTKKHVQAKPRTVSGRDNTRINDNYPWRPPSAYAGRTQPKGSKGTTRCPSTRGRQLETKPHHHGDLPTMYYPETTKNATHVYVEREKNQAGTYVRHLEGPYHQENWSTPTGDPSGVHSQGQKEARDSGYPSVKNRSRFH